MPHITFVFWIVVLGMLAINLPLSFILILRQWRRGQDCKSNNVTSPQGWTNKELRVALAYAILSTCLLLVLSFIAWIVPCLFGFGPEQ